MLCGKITYLILSYYALLCKRFLVTERICPVELKHLKKGKQNSGSQAIPNKSKHRLACANTTLRFVWCCPKAILPSLCCQYRKGCSFCACVSLIALQHISICCSAPIIRRGFFMKKAMRKIWGGCQKSSEEKGKSQQASLPHNTNYVVVGPGGNWFEEASKEAVGFQNAFRAGCFFSAAGGAATDRRESLQHRKPDRVVFYCLL